MRHSSQDVLDGLNHLPARTRGHGCPFFALPLLFGFMGRRRCFGEVGRGGEAGLVDDALGEVELLLLFLETGRTRFGGQKTQKRPPSAEATVSADQTLSGVLVFATTENADIIRNAPPPHSPAATTGKVFFSTAWA